MKAQVLTMKEAQGVGKKSNKPYNGYFVTFLHLDADGNLNATQTFVDRDAVPELLPPDTMVDVVTVFGSTRIAKLNILPKEQPFMIRA